MLKLQNFGYLMEIADSLEKTLMLGKIECRRRGQQRTRWLYGNIDSMDMNLSKLWQVVKDREARCAAVHGFTKSQTWLSDWTTTVPSTKYKLCDFSDSACSLNAPILALSLALYNIKMYNQMCTNAFKFLCLKSVKPLSYVWPFMMPWTVAYKSLLIMEFPRKEYWSGLLFPSPGDLPSSGTAGRFFIIWNHQGGPFFEWINWKKKITMTSQEKNNWRKENVSDFNDTFSLLFENILCAFSTINYVAGPG